MAQRWFGPSEEDSAMAHEFDDRNAVHVHRDHDGIARDLLHTDEPNMSSARTPQLAAHEYLEKFGPMLGIAHDQLRHLGLPPELDPIDTPVEFRFLDEKVQFDTTTPVFSQTCLGLLIREAGPPPRDLGRRLGQWQAAPSPPRRPACQLLR
jgi:zinc metalloprotease ZmpB